MRLREDLMPCAIEWKYGYNMIDVVALSTFVFQPVVLLKLILFWIYWASLTEGVKVYLAARNSLWSIDHKKYICFGKLKKPNFDKILFHAFMVIIMIPSCGFFFLAFLISGSVAFGIFFIAIVLVAMLFHSFLFGSLSLLFQSSQKFLAAESARNRVFNKAKNLKEDPEDDSAEKDL